MARHHGATSQHSIALRKKLIVMVFFDFSDSFCLRIMHANFEILDLRRKLREDFCVDPIRCDPNRWWKGLLCLAQKVSFFGLNRC